MLETAIIAVYVLDLNKVSCASTYLFYMHEREKTLTPNIDYKVLKN